MNVSGSILHFVTALLFISSFSLCANIPIPEQASEKLILTPLIKAGKIAEAQESARVRGLDEFGLTKDVVSYSGFLTVNETCESQLFFWFFPSMASPESDPIIMLHGGGPGVAGVSSLFGENGPFIVGKDDKLSFRNLSWTSVRSILYVDSPVGAGFSEHRDAPECYVNLTSTTADHIHIALGQFFKLFPTFRSNDFYIFATSYGGKFAPAIAHKIHKENMVKEPSSRVNMKGLCIASGWSDPLTQLGYGDFYYNYGIIDEKERDYFKEKEALAKQRILQEDYSSAFDIIEPLILGTRGEPSHLVNVTGISNMYSVHPERLKDMTHHAPFLNNNASFRKKIHVAQIGGTEYTDSSSVISTNFRHDTYRSIKPLMEDLLDYGLYEILVVSNQMDLIVPHTTIYNFVANIKSPFGEDFKRRKQRTWMSPDEGAVGYFKRTGKLTYILLRDAGHLWIVDRPLSAFRIMEGFTSKGGKFLTLQQ